MVSGAAFTERVIVQPLTEGVFIHPVEEDQERESLDAAIHRVARLIQGFALKKGIESLASYYTQLQPDALPTGPSRPLRSTRSTHGSKQKSFTGKTRTAAVPVPIPRSTPALPTFDPSVPIRLACLR